MAPIHSTQPDEMPSMKMIIWPSKDEFVNVAYQKASVGYNYRRVFKDHDDDIYYSGWMDCYDWLTEEFSKKRFKSNVVNRNIEDLSYSNLGNLIQGEEIKAADVLHECAVELEKVVVNIAELEQSLSYLRSRKAELINAGQLVAKHIQRDLPLAVKRQNYLVIVSENNLTIERNVI